jgi:hypothetical protein
MPPTWCETAGLLKRQADKALFASSASNKSIMLQSKWDDSFDCTEMLHYKMRWSTILSMKIGLMNNYGWLSWSNFSTLEAKHNELLVALSQVFTRTLNSSCLQPPHNMQFCCASIATKCQAPHWSNMLVSPITRAVSQANMHVHHNGYLIL